jgi:hypothetical protein
MFMLMPIGGFSYSKGAPKQFTRSAVTRAFHQIPEGLPSVERLPKR